MAMQSGDLCRFGVGAYTVEHYRCDEYADGTITDVRTGGILHRPHYTAPRGFNRPDASKGA